MKMIVLLMSAAFSFILAAPVRAVEELAVVVSGKTLDPVEAYRAESRLYIDAKRVGELYGGQVYWYPVSGRVELSLRGRSLRLLAGSDKASLGEEELPLGAPVLVRVSRAFVPVSFLAGDGFARWSGHETRYDERARSLIIERRGTVGAPHAFSYKGRTRVSASSALDSGMAVVKDRRLIVIDPGHGGKDPGAMGRRGTREKDVNLAAALELARVLRERGDFDVLLTRNDDVFVPLSARSELANSKEADLFVSLHCNAAGDSGENGFEVYSVSEAASDPAAEKLADAENAVIALEGKDPQDEMAKMILLAMTKTEMINESAAFAALAAKTIGARVDLAARGAKQAGFYVLRGTHAPAILIEMAFVSHPKDEAKLASRRFRRAMAEGAASAVADYARRQGWLQ